MPNSTVSINTLVVKIAGEILDNLNYDGHVNANPNVFEVDYPRISISGGLAF